MSGVLFGRQLLDLAHLFGQPGFDAYRPLIIVIALAVYAFVTAIPFVPGAEIGLGLLLMLGPEIAVLVYVSTVLALTLAYLVGRAVPAGACAAAFAFFGFRKTRDLVLEMAALDPHARLELLLQRAPKRIVPRLLRHRYLALAVTLNLPGNTLLGGGGGIALMAGLSGLYPMPAYLMTVVIAVVPVPLLVGLSQMLL